MNNTQMTLVVNTTRGEIKANFDELKVSLNQNLDKYRLVKYSDDAEDQMRQMKQDRAELNKLTTALKEKDKEVKKAIMVPYDTFHEGVVELLALVEEPKQVIDAKVKELEEAAREAKRADIRAEYETLAVNVDTDFKEELYKRLYDPKWENATATKKAYKEGLKKGVDNFCYGMQCLRLSNHEFLEDGIREFKLTLDLTSAINLMEKKAKEKAELLQREQERLENERKRIEEEADKRLEEERKRIEKEADEKLEKERKRLEEEVEEKVEEKLKEEREQRKSESENATVEQLVEKKTVTPVTTGVYMTSTLNPVSSASKPEPVPVRVNDLPRTDANVVGKVIVAFEPSDWNLIKKYADRMGISYMTK